ncbi:DUF5667 domain-containing protein [Nocardioides pakistanensis]
MTSLFQARRSAEEFAAAVDGGDSPSRRSLTPETESLLAVVGALRSHEPATPRAEFSADLRERLMAEAETVLRPESSNLLLPARERGRRERRLVAAASAFVLIGGTTTMAAAAQSSLPGDALYPIKRGIERAEAQLNVSPAGKGKDLLSQASDRLVEVEGLLVADTAQAEPRVPETLAEFTASAVEGADLMFDSYRETGDPEAIVAVRGFARDGIDTLQQLAGDVPASAQGDLAAAAITLHDIDLEATELCSTCAADAPVVEVPDILLARAEVDRALALASERTLDNNHPVVVSKGLTGPRSAPTASAEGRPSSQPSATASPDAAPTGMPTPSWEPETWPTLLPGLEGGGTTSKQDDPKGPVEQLTEDLTDSLNGVVETLLPDLDGDGLLP